MPGFIGCTVRGCMLGLCLLVAAMPARAADAAAPKMVLDQAIAALPTGWAVRYAGSAPAADGSLTLTDVVLSHDGALLLAAGSVKITGLRGDGSAAAPYAADRVEASALGEPGTGSAAPADAGTAEALVVTGIAVGPGDSAGLPPASEAAAIVLALTSVRIDHAELSRLHQKDMTVAQVTLDHMAAGRVATATVTEVSSDDAGQRSGLRGIEANDVDLGRLARVFLPSAYAPNGAPGAARLAIGPAVGRFAMRGLSVVKAGETTRCDAVELTDLRLGQAPEPPVGKTLLAAPMAIGSGVLGGIGFEPGTGGGAGFQIASIALTNYQDGRFDALQVGETGFSDPGNHLKFGLKSAVVRGFDANGLLIGWSAGGTPADAGASPPTPRLAGFELNELFAVSPAGDRITVGAIRDALNYQDNVPVSQELTVSRLTVPAHALADTVPPAALAAFGRDSVTAGLDFKLVWDPQSHDLGLAPFRITAEDLGALTLTATLGNVDLSLLNKGGMAAMAGLVVATIKRGELVYEDHSLLERAIAGFAATTGQTPQQVRQMLVGQLTKMKSPLPSRPRLPAILAGFVQHPTSLTARVTPAQPMPAALLAAGSPDDTAKQLALEVTAK